MRTVRRGISAEKSHAKHRVRPGDALETSEAARLWNALSSTLRTVIGLEARAYSVRT